MEIRKISNTIARRLTPHVLALVEKGFDYVEICKVVRLSEFQIKGILTENNIEIKKPVKPVKPKKIKDSKTKKPRGYVDRNQQIFELLQNDETYISIARKYNITKQRVRQIASTFNYDRMSINKQKILDLIVLINADVDAGLKYKEINEKYKLNAHMRTKLAYHGLPLFSQLMDQRKNLVVNEYKTKIARKVLESDVKGIHNPFELTNINSVYTISSKMGYKRYPKIGNRSKGGMQESIEILELIKYKREVENLSFRKISIFLNSVGKKTISDKPFTSHNTSSKYYYYTGKLTPLNTRKKKNKFRNTNNIDKPADRRIVIRLKQ